MSAPVKKRFEELDALRGIAVLMVVVFHYTSRYDEVYPGRELGFSFAQGHFGVELFFMISGFVILFSLERVKTARSFVLARISRLYPPYWCAVIFTFLIVSCFSLPGRERTWMEALINLTMIQRLFSVADVDGVYWSLAIEMAFYGVLCLCLVCKLLPRLYAVTSVWLIGMLLVNISPVFPEGSYVLKVLKMGLLLEHATLFVLGMMFYKLHQKESQVKIYTVIALALVVQYAVHGLVNGLFTTLFVFVFYLFCIEKLTFLVRWPFLFLGHVSYSLYLIHQNLGYIIIRYFEEQNLSPLWAILTATGVSLSVAFVMYFYIEQKLCRWLKQKLESWSASQERVKIH